MNVLRGQIQVEKYNFELATGSSAAETKVEVLINEVVPTVGNVNAVGASVGVTQGFKIIGVQVQVKPDAGKTVPDSVFVDVFKEPEFVAVQSVVVVLLLKSADDDPLKPTCLVCEAFT